MRGTRHAALVGREASDVEPGEVDTVSEQAGVLREVQPLHQRQILGVLDELDIGEAGRDCLERVDGTATRPRVVLARVEAMDGVHDHRNVREPTYRAPVHARLGVVGVQYVDVFAPEDAVQLARGAQVGDRVGRASRRRERNMTDAGALELPDERTGRADPDCLSAGLAHCAELREQEQAQAHVHGCQVRDLHRSPRSTVR